MKGNNFDNLINESKNIEKIFENLKGLIPQIINEASQKASVEEREKLEYFSKRASEISSNNDLSYAEKITKIEELKRNNGNSNNNK